MKELFELLKSNELTIGSCESLTAGLFCDLFASLPGASAVLKGGIITYQTIVKELLVGVDHEVIIHDGVVSTACAKQMAQKTRVLLNSDICVSFTGNAGPDMLEEKPIGYVCCAIAYKEQIWTYELHLQGDRAAIRKNAVTIMVEEIKKVLKKT